MHVLQITACNASPLKGDAALQATPIRRGLLTRSHRHLEVGTW